MILLALIQTSPLVCRAFLVYEKLDPANLDRGILNKYIYLCYRLAFTLSFIVLTAYLARR